MRERERGGGEVGREGASVRAERESEDGRGITWRKWLYLGVQACGEVTEWVRRGSDLLLQIIRF